MHWITKTLAMLCLLLPGGRAMAETVFTYTYTGQALDLFVAGSEQSELTTANELTFSFESSTVLLANTTYDLTDLHGVLTPGIAEWRVSDGSSGFDSSSTAPRTGLSGDSFVSTNGHGMIVSWGFAAGEGGQIGSDGQDDVSCGPTACLSSIARAGEYAGDYIQVDPATGSFLYAGSSDRPGTWLGPVATDIPEPGTALLFGTAVVGIGLSRLRGQTLRINPRH